MGLDARGARVLRTSRRLDRPAAPAARSRPPPHAARAGYGPSTRDGARETRTAATLGRPRSAAWSYGREDQRAESALALGIVLAPRTYLPELAPRQHAGVGARLRADS